jgi:hypothetical protein
MFEYLTPFRVVLVSGIHRSGTTITAKMIAHDLAIPYYVGGEDYSSGHLREWLGMINNMSAGVIQGAAMCYYLDVPGDRDDIAVCFVRRNIIDVLASQKRIGWTPDHPFLGPRYRREMELYGVERPPLYPRKLQYWETYQKPRIRHAFDIEYESLSGHPMWVSKQERKGWAARQTE